MSYQEREPRNGESGSEGMARLEKAVQNASVRLRELARELAAARAEGARLGEQLQRFTSGEEDPSEMLERLQRLEAENRILLERLGKGREGVERLLARVRFLEEQG